MLFLFSYDVPLDLQRHRNLVLKHIFLHETFAKCFKIDLESSQDAILVHMLIRISVFLYFFEDINEKDKLKSTPFHKVPAGSPLLY